MAWMRSFEYIQKITSIPSQIFVTELIKWKSSITEKFEIGYKIYVHDVRAQNIKFWSWWKFWRNFADFWENIREYFQKCLLKNYKIKKAILTREAFRVIWKTKT